MSVDHHIMTKAVLMQAGVREQDADFVLRNGIPEGEVGHLLVRPEVGDALVLAVDGPVPLRVERGQVLPDDGTARLVNETIVGFILVLERYGRYVNEVLQATSEREGEEIAIQAVEDMKRIDPGAFEDPNSYWPIVCAQMVDGNL